MPRSRTKVRVNRVNRSSENCNIRWVCVGGCVCMSASRGRANAIHYLITCVFLLFHLNCPFESSHTHTIAVGIRLQFKQFSRYSLTSRRTARPGYGRHFWSVRQGVPTTGQKEEVRDKSASQDPESCLQWNIHI